jgi:hypothetical protein
MDNGKIRSADELKTAGLKWKEAGATVTSAKNFLRTSGLKLEEANFEYCSIEELKRWLTVIGTNQKYKNLRPEIEIVLSKRFKQQNDSKSGRSNNSESSAFPTDWAIGVISVFTLGIALPFLLWMKGPKTKKRRRKIIFSTLPVVFVVAAMGTIGVLNPVEIETTSGVNRVVYMPNVIGSPLGTARETLESLDGEYEINEQDLISDRGVWNYDNWVVSSQSPRAGAPLSKNEQVCIGIVKNDETWQTPNQLQCWESAADELSEISGYTMPLKDLIKMNNLPISLNGMHLKAEVEIEMDRGNTVFLPFCTYAVVANGSTNLKLDAGNGGDPGLFANGGQSFEAGLFLEWTGNYKMSINRLEKSRTSRC